MTERKMPENESRWVHHSGKQYTVLCITNKKAARLGFPQTVVYVDDDSNIWSRPLDDWHGSFAPLPPELEKDVDPCEETTNLKPLQYPVSTSDVESIKELAASPLLYALDYDGTCTSHIPFWTAFIVQARASGIAVIVVTMRTPEEGKWIDMAIAEAANAVICTSRKAKREFCASLALHPDVWIDDAPAAILFDADEAYAMLNPKEKQNFGVIQGESNE
jgi:hypothetical protein